MLPIWILVCLKCTDKDSSAALYVREFVGNIFRRLLTQVIAESGDTFILHWVGEGYRVDTDTTAYLRRIQAVGLGPIDISLSQELENISRKAVSYVLIRLWHLNLLDPPYNQQFFCSAMARADGTALRRTFTNGTFPKRILKNYIIPSYSCASH